MARMLNQPCLGGSRKPQGTLMGIRTVLLGGLVSLALAAVASPAGAVLFSGSGTVGGNSVAATAIFQANQCSIGCPGTNVNVGGEWGYQHTTTGFNLVGSAGYVTSGLPGNL